MSEIKLPPLPAEYYLVCGRRTWDEKDMQEYACQAVREAVPEVRNHIEYDADKEHPAVNDFSHWLNARRDMPVSEAFHDIVQCYRSLHSQYLAAAKERP